MSYRQVWINGQVVMMTNKLCRETGIGKPPVDRPSEERSGPVRHVDPTTLSEAYLDDLLARAQLGSGEHE